MKRSSPRKRANSTSMPAITQRTSSSMRCGPASPLWTAVPRRVSLEEVWKKWLLLPDRRRIKTSARKATRDFGFGDGSVVRSSVEVAFEVVIYGRSVAVSASLIPGSNSLLLARPVLEDWGVVQDFPLWPAQVV